MPPKKRTKNVNWPKYVNLSNGRIVYRPRINIKDHANIEVDSRGFLKPPIRLGKVGDSDQSILRNYVAAVEQIEFSINKEKFTLEWLFNEYQDSLKFKNLSPSSVRNYSMYMRKLSAHEITIDSQPSRLGLLNVKELTTPMIRRLFEKRLKTYQAEGKKGTVQVNRELATLSAVISWGMEFIDKLGVAVNPCFGVSRQKEQARERYVTDREYDIQYQLAAEIADYLQPLMEHCYLLACRTIEARSLKDSDISDEGYLVRRRKGSKTNRIKWSPRLIAAHQLALDLRKSRTITMIDSYLITGRDGSQLQESTILSAMRRLNKLMIEKGCGDIYWTLHHLKHKGVSDSKDDNIAGHKSEQMKQRYDHSIDEINPAG